MAAQARGPRDFVTVQATTGQYAAGGPSACAAISLAVAAAVLRGGDVSTAVLDATVRAGAAQHGGSQHLEAFDLVLQSDVLELQDQRQFADADALLNALGDERPFGATAYVITKPPEVVVVLHLPRGAASAGGARWVYVDSHPRGDRGLPNAYALCFDTLAAMCGTLRGREPLIAMREEGLEMYNVCEYLKCGVREGVVAAPVVVPPPAAPAPVVRDPPPASQPQAPTPQQATTVPQLPQARDVLGRGLNDVQDAIRKKRAALEKKRTDADRIRLSFFGRSAGELAKRAETLRVEVAKLKDEGMALELQMEERRDNIASMKEQQKNLQEHAQQKQREWEVYERRVKEEQREQERQR
ncbi:MAG: hypothetical protein Q8J97_15890, partial [Flavobacteriaceae bacterium]|nr:hypothetical protein [Flavobacteriaceae bacterium]